LRDRDLNSKADRNWLWLGYALTLAPLIVRICQLASGSILLSRDEAYQWLWSKHLALSYYSKPLGIALVQWAGTHLWGDTELGVRFFAPVFSAILSIVMLRFITREVGARAAFWLLLAVSCTPLMALGSIIMTVDQPLVFFGTIGMIIGWRALQPDGRLIHWLAVGVAWGLAFLSKYSAVYELICVAIFFGLWPPARVQLRKPGPWLALLVFALSTLPVLIWNSQHGWITIHHVAENAGLQSTWHPTLGSLGEFVLVEFGILNPVFFVFAVWAMIAMWRVRPSNPLWIYFFCFSAPIFLGHLLYTLHSRVQPNWIALGVVPMFCLMAAYWNSRWLADGRALRGWLVAGISIGCVAAAMLYFPGTVVGMTGRPFAPERDPIRRLQGWRETAAVVENARESLGREGKATFIIADHYGLTGLLSFYLPAGRPVPGQPPLVYCVSSPEPHNQLFFWPEYRYRESRTGDDAIFATELDPQPLEKGWVAKWWRREPILPGVDDPLNPPPPALVREFESVADLGVHGVFINGQPNVYRRLHLFACRNLKPPR
jgi:Dolichyl-phosphate-mannose-protein mannosyltransferase